VKRLGKILLISLAALAVLLLAGFWMLNRWVQSPAMHAHIERELSKALRLPLKFTKLSVSPGGGITATGVTVPDVNGNFFEASSFTALYNPASLARGRLMISEMSINGPKFSVSQSAPGKWRIPPLPAEIQAELDARRKPKSPKSATGSAATTPKPAAKKSGPAVSVEKLTIIGGAAELYDETGAPYATLSDVRLSLPGITEEKIEGSLAIGYAVLYGKLALHDFHAGVSYSETKGFISPAFQAKAGGGKVTGSFATMPEKATDLGMPFSAKISLADVDVLRACSEASAEQPNLTGILSGSATLRGVGDHRKLLQGKGSVTLKNGTFQELEMVRQLGEFLEIQNAAHFGIENSTLNFQIGNDRLFVDQLSVDAPPLILSATGSSKLDGKLDLDAVLSVANSFLENRSTLAAQFSKPDANGRRTLPFDIGGTWSKPKSNLLERATGTTDRTVQKIIVGESVLRRAIDEVKSKADEEKKERKK
jgi:hypothetical protein